MGNTILDELEKQLETKLADINRDLAAVRWTQSLLAAESGSNANPVKPQPVVLSSTEPIAVVGPRSYGEVAEAVRVFVSNSTSMFTLKDVEIYLTKSNVHFKPGTVRSVINRMIDKNIIKIAKEGSGRKPTYYVIT